MEGETPMITVAEMMTTGAKTLTKADSMADVQAAMLKFSCHHIPIVANGAELVGLVSQRDVLRVAESSLIGDTGRINPDELKIADFMTSDVFTVQPETSLRKAAIYIRTQRYGCLPVVAGKQLVGIITDSDFVNIAIDLLEQIHEGEPLEDE
jgi:CBS domain-containing membrane protein